MINFEANQSVIDQLNALDDDALMEAVGLKAQLANIKKTLAEMAALKGEGRKTAERKVRNMLSPEVGEDRLHWALEDAKRENKGRKDIADVCC